MCAGGTLAQLKPYLLFRFNYAYLYSCQTYETLILSAVSLLLYSALVCIERLLVLRGSTVTCEITFDGLNSRQVLCK